MRWGRFIVAALALAGLAPASAEAADRTPVSPSAAWAPNADDSWLFDVRSGQYRLGDGVRGYQTPQGICVDLGDVVLALDLAVRSEEHTSELQSLMRISYAVFCLKKKNTATACPPHHCTRTSTSTISRSLIST